MKIEGGGVNPRAATQTKVTRTRSSVAVAARPRAWNIQAARGPTHQNLHDVATPFLHLLEIRECGRAEDRRAPKPSPWRAIVDIVQPRIASETAETGTGLASLLEQQRRQGTAFCRKIVSDAGRAEDLYQDACLKLLRRGLERPEDERGALALLYRTLLNLCRDELRRAGRPARRHLSLDVDLAIVEDGRNGTPVPSPVERLDLLETQHHMARAIRQLEPRQLAALRLRTQDGCSYRQIATRLGVSESNVGVLIFRARERLRNLLDTGQG